MANYRRRSIVVLGVLAVFTGLAGAQTQLTCTTNAAFTPTLRGEGFAEKTGDIVLTCVGGIPIPAGQLVPLVNISIFYNTTVTNRLLPTAGNPATNNVSDALLLIDEPGSPFPGTLAQTLCPTPLTGCPVTVGAPARTCIRG